MTTFLQHLLSFNSIRGNFIKAFIAMAAITACLLTFTWWQSKALEKDKELLLEQIQPARLAGQSYTAGLHKTLVLMQAYLQTGDEQYRTEIESLLQDKIRPEEEKLSKAFQELQNTKGTANLNQLIQLRENFEKKQEAITGRILQQLKSNGFYQNDQPEHLLRAQAHIRKQLQDDILPLILEAENLTTLLLVEASNYSEASVAQIDQRLSLLRTASVIALLANIALALVLGYFLLSQLFRSFQHIKEAVRALRLGNLPELIKQSRNETAEITEEISGLSEHLRQVKELAVKIGKGEFDHSINVFDNEGELGSALAGMKDSLSRVAKEDRQRNWINEGFAKFGDILRANNHSIAELCDAAISNLVKYVGANQGAIFLIEENGWEDGEKFMSLQACYAYDKKKYLNKKVLKGEGIAGQCWQENDLILLSDIPNDYINIRSGLGGSNPSTVLVVPLTVNEEIQGVLELASFRNFEVYQQEFIQKICENMAAAISNARNNERTLRLLEESQMLAEAMSAQEEEMRQNMEELEATQEEMQRAQHEIIRKEQNLNSVINNTTDTIFAIDTEYTITVVNHVLRDKYKALGIKLEIGTKISDILPKSAWEKWKARYDRALSGEQYSIIEESTGADGSKFSQTYHNPIRNEQGEITGVSVMSRDVTEVVLNQRQIQQKQSTLNAIINSTGDTYFAIDTDYRILIANKTLKERFAVSGISLEEGDLIFDKLPKAQHEYWKKLYDRALTGESFVINQERPVGDKVLFIEVYCHPIRDEESGDIIGASVMSKDITRWKTAIDEKAEREKEIQKLRNALGLETNVEEQVMKKKDTPKKPTEATK